MYQVVWDDTTAEPLSRLSEAEIVYLLLDVTGDLKVDPHRGPAELWHSDGPRSFYTLDVGHLRLGYWTDSEKGVVTVVDVVAGPSSR